MGAVRRAWRETSRSAGEEPAGESRSRAAFCSQSRTCGRSDEVKRVAGGSGIISLSAAQT